MTKGNREVWEAHGPGILLLWRISEQNSLLGADSLLPACQSTCSPSLVPKSAKTSLLAISEHLPKPLRHPQSPLRQLQDICNWLLLSLVTSQAHLQNVPERPQTVHARRGGHEQIYCCRSSLSVQPKASQCHPKPPQNNLNGLSGAIPSSTGQFGVAGDPRWKLLELVQELVNWVELNAEVVSANF